MSDTRVYEPEIRARLGSHNTHEMRVPASGLDQVICPLIACTVILVVDMGIVIVDTES